MNWIDKHNANKKLSIYTSIISFFLGCIWVFVNLIWRGRTVTKEEAIAVVIILLGLNAVSFGSDLRGFLKILKNDKVLRLICNFIIVVVLGFTFNIVTGISIALITSLSKELYDEIKYKGWSWDNLIADLIGIALGIIVV